MTPQEEFDIMLEKTGIKKYHDAGYLGQGINLLNCDDNEHGEGMMNVIKKGAPRANLVASPVTINTKCDVLISATVNNVDLHQYVKTNHIHIINASLRGRNNSCKGWNDYCEKMQSDTGVIIVNAAGNSSVGNGETLCTQFPHNVAILLGALNINNARITYSSVGEELDFMAYAPLASGTSTASALFSAMLAVLFSANGVMPPSVLYAYLKAISKDLGTPGDDTYYGWGQPILPEVTTMLKITGRLVDNFPLTEMVDPISGELPLTPAITKHAQMMQELRAWYNKSMTVNSWYRTPEHNSEVGGDPNSCHLDGIATDIALPGLTQAQINNFTAKWQKICVKYGVIGGISIYEWGLHFDSNNTPGRYGRVSATFRVTDFR